LDPVSKFVFSSPKHCCVQMNVQNILNVFCSVKQCCAKLIMILATEVNQSKLTLSGQ